MEYKTGTNGRLQSLLDWLLIVAHGIRHVNKSMSVLFG